MCAHCFLRSLLCYLCPSVVRVTVKEITEDTYVSEHGKKKLAEFFEAIAENVQLQLSLMDFEPLNP